MNQLNPYLGLLTNNWVIIPVLVWSLFWEGCAMWVAAKNNQKIWFWVILVLNTIGILEIIYIFFVAKKSWSELGEIITKPENGTE
jgi:methionyl-tRNA synthetase